MSTITGERNSDKWKALYKIAGTATIVMLILIPIQIAVFSVSPIPSSVEEWYALFQSNWLLGLLHQDALYIINNIIVALMYLAFYTSLKSTNESLMTLALLLGFLGISAYFSSSTSLEMFELSKLYDAATLQSEKDMLLIAGQALVAQWQGTAFTIYYILNGIALTLIALVMLKAPVYGKRTAIIGIAAGLFMMIPSTFGTIGLIFSLLSLIPWYIFAALSAKKFFAFARK